MNSDKNMRFTTVLTKDRFNQIKIIATQENCSAGEIVRRILDKGLSIKGYSEDIDAIAKVIRQELKSLYSIEDLKDEMSKNTERIIKLLLKGSKLDAGGFYLLLKLCNNLQNGNDSSEAFKTMLNESMKMGIEYMQLKDFEINEHLQDTNNLLDKAKEL